MKNRERDYRTSEQKKFSIKPEQLKEIEKTNNGRKLSEAYQAAIDEIDSLLPEWLRINKQNK